MPSVEMSSRLFSVLHRERVAVLMISQASADSSICLGIQESDADRALEAVRAEFFRELDATENIKARGGRLKHRKRRADTPHDETTFGTRHTRRSMVGPTDALCCSRSRASRSKRTSRSWPSSARGWPSGH